MRQKDQESNDKSNDGRPQHRCRCHIFDDFDRGVKRGGVHVAESFNGRIHHFQADYKTGAEQERHPFHAGDLEKGAARNGQHRQHTLDLPVAFATEKKNNAIGCKTEAPDKIPHNFLWQK